MQLFKIQNVASFRFTEQNVSQNVVFSMLHWKPFVG